MATPTPTTAVPVIDSTGLTTWEHVTVTHTFATEPPAITLQHAGDAHAPSRLLLTYRRRVGSETVYIAEARLYARRILRYGTPSSREVAIPAPRLRALAWMTELISAGYGLAFPPGK